MSKHQYNRYLLDSDIDPANRKYDNQVDAWTLGILTFELLTGRILKIF